MIRHLKGKMGSRLNIQRLAASYWLGVISEVIGKMARTFIPSGREVQKAEVKFRVLAEDGFQRKARIEVLCREPFAVIKRRLVLVP